MILILEDQEYRKKIFRKLFEDNYYTIVDTVENAIELLKEHPRLEQLFLDHDLLPAYQPFYSQHSGLRLVDYIIKSDPPILIDKITIHSINRAASNKMFTLLIDAGYEVTLAPIYKIKE